MLRQQTVGEVEDVLVIYRSHLPVLPFVFQQPVRGHEIPDRRVAGFRLAGCEERSTSAVNTHGQRPQPGLKKFERVLSCCDEKLTFVARGQPTIELVMCRVVLAVRVDQVMRDQITTIIGLQQVSIRAHKISKEKAVYRRYIHRVGGRPQPAKDLPDGHVRVGNDGDA